LEGLEGLESLRNLRKLYVAQEKPLEAWMSLKNLNETLERKEYAQNSLVSHEKPMEEANRKH
jgi:hypothetical protein